MEPIILITVLTVTLIAFVELMPGCRRARHRWAQWALMAEMDRNVEAMKAEIALAFWPVMTNVIDDLMQAFEHAGLSMSEFGDAALKLSNQMPVNFDGWQWASGTGEVAE